MAHALRRTNDTGKPFVGKCMKCGKEGLRSGAALEPCPNDEKMSDEEALIQAIQDDEFWEKQCR